MFQFLLFSWMLVLEEVVEIVYGAVMSYLLCAISTAIPIVYKHLLYTYNVHAELYVKSNNIREPLNERIYFQIENFVLF